MQSLNAHMDQHVEIQQGFSPLLMQANHILSLSQPDLEAAVAEAVDENPALELEDCVVCPVCGRRTSGEPCATCRSAPPELLAVTRPDEGVSRGETEYRSPSTADPDFDPMSVIASATDVRQQILEAAVASFGDQNEQTIALVLVDAIDDRGFLSLGLDEIAAETDSSVETVERVLYMVQMLAPPGVAARSLSESLRL